MDALQEKLLELKKKKEALEKRLASLKIPSTAKRKSRTENKRKRELERIKVLVQNRTTKEVIDGIEESIEPKEHWCVKLGWKLETKVCLMKLFVSDHPKHKECLKCKKFDSYIDTIYRELSKNEKKK